MLKIIPSFVSSKTSGYSVEKSVPQSESSDEQFYFEFDDDSSESFVSLNERNICIESSLDVTAGAEKKINIIEQHEIDKFINDEFIYIGNVGIFHSFALKYWSEVNTDDLVIALGALHDLYGLGDMEATGMDIITVRHWRPSGKSTQKAVEDVFQRLIERRGSEIRAMIAQEDAALISIFSKIMQGDFPEVIFNAIIKLFRSKAPALIMRERGSALSCAIGRRDDFDFKFLVQAAAPEIIDIIADGSKDDIEVLIDIIKAVAMINSFAMCDAFIEATGDQAFNLLTLENRDGYTIFDRMICHDGHKFFDWIRSWIMSEPFIESKSKLLTWLIRKDTSGGKKVKAKIEHLMDGAWEMGDPDPESAGFIIASLEKIKGLVGNRTKAAGSRGFTPKKHQT